MGWWGVPRVSQAVTYTTYLYVPNSYANKVSGYSLNTSTGAISAISGSPFSASGGFATRAAATPDGKFLYVTHGVSNGTTIQQFSINSSTGALSSLGTSASGSQEPTAVAVTPNGSYLYVTSTNAAMISWYSINSSTGALTSLGTTSLASGAYPLAIAISANGSYLYTANQGTETVSGFTVGGDGSLSEISGSPWTHDVTPGCSGSGCDPTSLYVTPNTSYLFAGNNGGNITAYSIDGSGALTKFTGGSPAGTITTSYGTNDLVVSNDGKYLYATVCGAVSKFDITSANGTISSITSLGETTTAGCGNPQHIGVSPAGSFLYTGDDGTASFKEFSINTSTGALTEVSGSPFSTQTLAADFAFAQVPTPPSVSFIAATQSGAESAGTLTITAQLSDTYTDTVTIPFTITGTATGSGTDYSITASPITITAGNTTADITITVTDDALDEDDETVIVTMGSPTNATQGATTVHTATITDNDNPPTIQFSMASSSGAESATPATIIVTLSTASAKTVTVGYATANGTAIAGSDYTAALGTLTFVAGDTSEDISVPVTDDVTDENDEMFTATLSSPSNASLGSTTTHTYTITNNDGEPTIGFATSNSSGLESVSPVIFAVSLSPASAKTVTVQYATADGTAITGFDYTAASGTLTFSPGEASKDVTVSITNDTEHEGDEAIMVTLSSPSNASLGSTTTHTYTITDNDPAGRISDQTAPSPPSSIITTVTATAAIITWTDPTDQDFAGADVLRNIPPSTAVSGTPIGSVAKGVQRYIDTMVSPATTYVYVLRSRDTSGNARNSAPFTIISLDVAVAPVIVPTNTPVPIVNVPTEPVTDLVKPSVEEKLVQKSREEIITEAKTKLQTIFSASALDALLVEDREALEIFLAIGDSTSTTQVFSALDRTEAIQTFGRIFARPPRTAIERASLVAMMTERPTNVPDLATHLRNLEAKIPTFANLHGRYPGDSALTIASVEEDWLALRILVYGVTAPARDVALERQTLRAFLRRAFTIVYNGSRIFKPAGVLPATMVYSQFFQLIRSCVYGNPEACAIGGP